MDPASPEGWDLPHPHLHRVRAVAADIDAYGHVNNAVYVRWLDETAWSHSSTLGLTPELCVGSRRSMAVLRTQVHYIAAAFAGDEVVTGTWILQNDSRLRVARRFQMRRAADGLCLLRALILYVCIDLDSGRACRMPPGYVERYRPLPDVLEAQARESVPFQPGVEPSR